PTLGGSVFHIPHPEPGPPGRARRGAAPPHRFFVTGLLPQHLRDEMGMTWTPRQDRALAAMLRTAGAVESVVPPTLRAFPLNVYLTDMRIRRRLGLRLV
ncbi:oxygenase MpaB family protein, partial [Nocardia tengchongensis]|uniref:oxygenase MpaB family protein n=1 Tax=Nocardia tengchongensis TaxID=2055889 RepID=UPI0036B5350B